MPRLSDIEAILTDNHSNWLTQMETNNYNSITVSVFRPLANVQSRVYGRNSGEEGETRLADINALLIGDSFFPVDARSGGTLSAGIIYTTSDIVEVGDRLEIDRFDTKSRRYEVITVESVGTTKSMFRKIKISALGD